MTAKQDISKFFGRIQKFAKASVSQQQMRVLAFEAIRLIVVRTRLGYGVKQEGGGRTNLKGLSPAYVMYRTRNRRYLSPLTSPTQKKSNLTLSGQMLDSMGIVYSKDGQISISPTGNRSGRFSSGLTNLRVAQYQASAGRVFNNLSKPEQTQLYRFYRNVFGDLLRNSRLSRF